MSKKTAKPKDEISYDIRDVVLAKIRGFPAWPAMVVDPDNVPKEVSKERPLGKKQSFYCVRFFPAGDYSWVLSKDLSKLKRHEIESYIAEPHKKSGDLLTGYKIALDPEKWEKEREEARIEAEEAEADEEVDELEGEEEADEDEEKPVKPKKRKRESEVGSAKASKPKPKKEKDAGDAPAKRKKSTEKGDKPPKSKKNGTKSKAMVESEDEGDRGDDAGPSKKASPPPAKKLKREKDEDVDPELKNDPEAGKVKEWRHKIQRAFLTGSTPKDEDMPALDTLFSNVEEFDMTVKYLQHSKIGKVMRHIAALEPGKVPRDGEYKIRDRAQALVNKWHTTINKEKPNGTADAKAMDTDKGVTNGGPPPPTSAESSVEKTTALEDGVKPDEDTPAVGDLTLGSALGDVTMSEVA